MSPEEEMSLLGGNDCPLHYHTADRDITHDQVLQFQDSESVRTVTATGNVTYNDDILLVNTTSGAVSLTLPIARGGKTYSVVRTAGANTVTLLPVSGNTINAAASVVIAASFTPVRIKALKGIGWVQV